MQNESADSAPVSVAKVQTDPRTVDRRFFINSGLKSWVGVPLIAKREVLGVLSFYTRLEHVFSDDEIDFLSTIANHAAIAIDNSLLYEHTKEQAVELEKANNVKSEFLSVMSHALRTPLSAVMGYTGMIQEGVFGPINTMQEKALEEIANGNRELVRMINVISEATAIEVGAVRKGLP